MTHDELAPLLWEALRALRMHYGPAINRAAEGIGIPYGQWYGWLMASRIFEPNPVSVDRLRRRSAYTSPQRLGEYLEQGIDLGLLHEVASGEFRLTDSGHSAVQTLIDTAYAAMVPLEPLEPADLDRLANLLHTLVKASLAAPEPPGKWCLMTARHYDPGEAAPAMVRIDQYLSDLDAYHDDAYLAAWEPYGVTGQGWEAFSTLWRHGPLKLDELHARLARRGYDRDTYAGELQEMIERGWVSQDGATYGLTDAGRSLREHAEATTDAYFYAPWAVLSEADEAELHGLLLAFRDGLQQLTA